MDQLTPDGGTYHKSCFKCHHCKGTLQVSCTVCLTLNSSSRKLAASRRGFARTRPPSKAASMFSGTQDKCVTCSKTVYPLEKYPILQTPLLPAFHGEGELQLSHQERFYEMYHIASPRSLILLLWLLVPLRLVIKDGKGID
uniref:LIM zinc-binding domain-containing protein n=1 Tax=Ananas comosus var. bracteatus TaxID=296719 RepID=A0A6V7QUP1_ANACO